MGVNMKRILILITMVFVFDTDTMAVEMNRVSFRERDVSSVRSSTPTPPPPLEYAVPYIPQHYDHTEEFHNESVLCFKLRRWVFQPISVVLQMTAGGLFVGSQCCMDKYPESAKILNGVGLGVSIASFMVNTILLKIDNKLEDMDNYILQRRNNTQNIPQAQPNGIYPAIIQR